MECRAERSSALSPESTTTREPDGGRKIKVQIKRIYDDPEESDGERYLADRTWPRGISKKRAQLTGWLKEIAPSENLRKRFDHDPERWSEFKRRYKLELRAKEKRDTITSLAETAGNSTVTLLYAARDRRHNNAAVLAEVLEEQFQTRSDETEKDGNRLIQPGIQIRQKISANTYPTLLLDPGYYTNDEDIAAGGFRQPGDLGRKC
jgi:uncharacterized protein YeaO (DUF488 family)